MTCLALLLGVLGCSEGDGDPALPSPSGSASGPGTHEPRPGKRDLPGWQLLQTWRRDQADYFGSRGASTLLLLPSPKAPRIAKVIGLADGNVLLRHAIGRDQWQSQDGWIAPSFLAFLDINVRTRKSRLSVVSRKGKTLLALGPGARVSPEADVAGGRLAYTTGSPESGMCIHVIEPPEAIEVLKYCGGTGTILGDVALDQRTLSYTTLTNWESEGRRCKRVRFTDLATGRSLAAVNAEVDRIAKCDGWSGMPSRGNFAWDVADPNNPELMVSPGFVTDAEGLKTRKLGDVMTDTFRSCGGSLFWEVARGRYEVRRLTTQASRPVLAPHREIVPATLECGEDRWLTTRLNDIGGKNERLSLIALDTRRDSWR